MQIITHSKIVNCVEYFVAYNWKDSGGGGFHFSGKEDGSVDLEALEKKPAALENYKKCLSGEYAVTGPFPGKHEWSYVDPAIGKCSCGCEVELDRFTNTCDGCGRDYNSSGQLLAHRSQWGEETGESYCDLQDL